MERYFHAGTFLNVSFFLKNLFFWLIFLAFSSLLLSLEVFDFFAFFSTAGFLFVNQTKVWQFFFLFKLYLKKNGNISLYFLWLQNYYFKKPITLIPMFEILFSLFSFFLLHFYIKIQFSLVNVHWYKYKLLLFLFFLLAFYHLFFRYFHVDSHSLFFMYTSIHKFIRNLFIPLFTNIYFYQHHVDNNNN